jgi:hypothetical protein
VHLELFNVDRQLMLDQKPAVPPPLAESIALSTPAGKGSA